ncbi:flagellar brake protein [Acidithiobacillus thiooxidans]|uniref:flagellar brake protein n=1 Tax=Acidithiobacillus thiooxidans TaxID=930 RepID=UPI001C06C923|nr:PilZ domain-containing protein [Acidithiobacillus thiooxidans]
MADLRLADRSMHVRFLPFAIHKTVLFDIPDLSPVEPVLKTGESVNVRWLRQKDGYHYHFVSSVLGLVANPKDGLPALSVAYPNFLERTQRRQSFRMQVPLDDALNMIVHLGTSTDDMARPAFAHDLSASGGRFSFSVPLDTPYAPDMDDVVSITLSLSGKQQTVKARIVRVNRVGTHKEHAEGLERWMIGVHFIMNQDPVFQEHLENYVISQQWKG